MSKQQGSFFMSAGSTAHTDEVRQPEDFYATDPIAIRELFKHETFSSKIWECACGQGHLSEEMKKHGYEVASSDLFDRGYGSVGVDFLGDNVMFWEGDIITNPPFKVAEQFIRKALEIVPEGNKVAMFLRLQFMESDGRQPLFTNTPAWRVYVTSGRIQCPKNGDFEKYKKGAPPISYAWFIWKKGYKGETTLKWFN